MRTLETKSYMTTNMRRDLLRTLVCQAAASVLQSTCIYMCIYIYIYIYITYTYVIRGYNIHKSRPAFQCQYGITFSLSSKDMHVFDSLYSTGI